MNPHAEVAALERDRRRRAARIQLAARLVVWSALSFAVVFSVRLVIIILFTAYN